MKNTELRDLSAAFKILTFIVLCMVSFRACDYMEIPELEEENSQLRTELEFYKTDAQNEYRMRSQHQEMYQNCILDRIEVKVKPPKPYLIIGTEEDKCCPTCLCANGQQL